MIGDGAFIYQ